VVIFGITFGGTMQTITVKIPDDMAAFLEKLAKEEERSKSYYIRKAISQYLEDKADILAAKKAMAEHKKNPKTYTLEEIMRENGLMD
jgi:RHH-type transcriptional regulator, rel operon repressor / antitoxin RelB